MRLEYINSNGKSVDLTQYDTKIYQGNFHSFAWDYNGIEQQYGVILQNFKKSPLIYEMQVAFRKEPEKNLNLFFETAETDIINKSPGKLYWNEHYLECFIIEQSTVPSDDFFGAIRTCQIFAPYPFWVKEETKSFTTESIGTSDFLDYNYGYNYDYSVSDVGSIIWATGHYAPSNFRLVIFGPVINPQIVIDGSIYQVLDTIDTNDYIIIDNRANTIIKYLNNGTQQNRFDYRNKDSNIFKPIPGGNVTINWNGDFGFDLTLFFERSEPAW